MIRLGGMWKATSKNGREYYSGKIGSARFFLMPNTFKKTDRDPDFNLMIGEEIVHKPEGPEHGEEK